MTEVIVIYEYRAAIPMNRSSTDIYAFKVNLKLKFTLQTTVLSAGVCVSV